MRTYTTRRVQEYSIHLEPCSPEDARYPHAVTINDTADVVARLELDLVLDIKVDNTHDTIRCEQVCERVDNRVELGNHGKTVAHSQEVCTEIISGTAFVKCALADAEYCAIIVETLLIVAEFEGTSILTDDLDVLPAKAGKSGPGDLAKRWRKIDEVYCVEEAGDRKVLFHLLDVPTGAATNVLQVQAELAQCPRIDIVRHEVITHDPNWLASVLALLKLMTKLSSSHSQHVFSSTKQSRTCDIVNSGLCLVKTLESILLIACVVSGVRLQEARVCEFGRSDGSIEQLANSLQLGER